MKSPVLVLLAAAAVGAASESCRVRLKPDATQKGDRAMPDVRLMTLDPGHFHAALVQKEMYFRDRRTLPAWERPNMLAKYYVTTKGTELSRQGPARPAPRIAR